MKVECFLFIVATLFVAVLSATTHKHTHSSNKERMEDGSYSPKNAHHFDGGEHHSEFDHEAILGSVKEAEEFDNLTPEEAQRRLSVLVLKMDLNTDGFIDRHELKAWILRSFRMLSQEEANERFQDVDENGDGQASWHEYMKDTYGLESEFEVRDSDEQYAEEESKLIQDDKVMFKAADKNGDELLSPEEFVVFLSPEEHPEMLPLILEQTLREKDKDGDGKIDFKEFVGDSAKHHDKEWLLVEKNRFDNEHDKDGDGVLNGNEILAWVVPSNEDVASDEVDHLFASSDDDHDDRLSHEEIITNYETFVGSEATDYGDQLQNIQHFSDEL
ncbi:reticulocalbin-2 [Phlebotomus argentipes]|uniref:reticulocalbin-2 n=1 Tax=Phlebotomus argentipes TaxID=94469 RepID=UPI002893192C|nr:reticulocalbin-2 [Phlebotomus argentipes]